MMQTKNPFVQNLKHKGVEVNQGAIRDLCLGSLRP